MREPKPHVVSFVASMLLLAGVSSVVDRPSGEETVAITVDPVTGSSPGATGNGDAPPAGAVGDATPGATDAPQQPAGTATAPGSSGPAPSNPGGQAQPTPTTPAPAPGSSGQVPPPSNTPAPAPATQYPEAPLYDDTEKFRGFDAEEIVMCGHAALALGAAFDTSREDLNVYWDILNDEGGIHGRQVEMTWEDDAYVSNVAVQAATTCADKNPFMILGGIGFDQIPGVRTWAEENRELYFHHIAVAPEQTYNYSFSLQPTVQLVGDEAGRYLARKHRQRQVGVMFRDTANWNPGSNAAMAVMDAAGMAYTRHPVFQNQGSYANEINQMQQNLTEVVFLWENALAAANIINQASEQGFYPIWVLFPFQQTIDLLTEAPAHTIEGVATWNAYAPGGYGGAFAEHGVDAEIARFEAAYATHRPETTPNDILWMVWVGNKLLHRMLLDCGAECNRNRFAGMMLSGYQAQELPACSINFADPRSFGGHHGGFAFFAQQKVELNGRQVYETTEYCRSTLG